MLCISNTITCPNGIKSIYMVYNSCNGIDQAKRHCCESLVTIPGAKCTFGDVYRVNSILMVSNLKSNLEEIFAPSS